MRGLLLKFIYFTFLTSSFSLQAQQSAHVDKLRQKISANSKLFTNNIDKAYLQLKPLLIESRSLKDSLRQEEKTVQIITSKN